MEASLTNTDGLAFCTRFSFQTGPCDEVNKAVEMYERFQVQIYIKLNAARTGVTVPVPRQRRLRLQEMHETRKRFQRQELTTKEYIKRMAYKVLPTLL
ncbi:hypothetical protein ACOMHN_066871 [Nucella lapillus]